MKGRRDRRRIKRLAPEDRREIRPMEQIAQLRFRIGQALPIRRAVGARPDAPAGGNDHDDSPLRRGDAPQFLEQRVRPVGRLQRVGEQQPIDAAVGQRQHLRVHERGRATSCSRPDRRRPAPRASRPGIGGPRRETVRDRACHNPSAATERPAHVVPARADHAPDQPAGDSAEGRAVEALQVRTSRGIDIRRTGRHDFERALGLSQCVGERRRVKKTSGGETGPAARLYWQAAVRTALGP